MVYHFSGTTHATVAEMLDHMARWYFTSAGMARDEDVTALLCDLDDLQIEPAEAAADEIIDGLALEQTRPAFLSEPPVPSHMAWNGYSRDDVVAAARRFIRERPDLRKEGDA